MIKSKAYFEFEFLICGKAFLFTEREMEKNPLNNYNLTNYFGVWK